MIKTIKKALSTFVVMAMITTLMPMIAGASQLENVEQMTVQLSSNATAFTDVNYSVLLEFDSENPFTVQNNGFVEFTFPELPGFDLDARNTAEDVEFMMIDGSGPILAGYTATMTTSGEEDNVLRVTFTDIVGPIGGILSLGVSIDNLVNPNASGSYIVSFDSSGNTYNGTYSAAFAIYQDEISVSAYIEPFIELEITDSVADLGELVPGTPGFAEARFTVNTNSSNGYRVALEASDLTDEDEDYSIPALNDEGEAVAIGTVREGWGFNLVANASAGSNPTIAIDADDRNAAADATVGEFGTADSFFVPDGTFPATESTRAAESEGASKDHQYTLTVAAIVDALTPTNLYTADIFVKVYAAF